MATKGSGTRRIFARLRRKLMRMPPRGLSNKGEEEGEAVILEQLLLPQVS